MSPTTEIRAELKDRWGDTHQYTSTLIDAWTGMPLFRKVQTALVHFAGHGLEGLTGQGKSLLDSKIKGVSIVAAVEPALQTLFDDREFVLALLSTTQRDGQQVGERGVFAVAYQGNYGEFIAAATWLIRENFVDPLIASLTSSFGEDTVTKLTARLLQLWNDTEKESTG